MTNNDAAAEAAFRGIFQSGWTADNLAGFALTFASRHDAHVPCWKGIIADTEDEAFAYYRSQGWLDRTMSEEDKINLRYEATEVLVAGGWDIRSINFRKS